MTTLGTPSFVFSRLPLELLRRPEKNRKESHSPKDTRAARTSPGLGSNMGITTKQKGLPQGESGDLRTAPPKYHDDDAMSQVDDPPAYLDSEALLPLPIPQPDAEWTRAHRVAHLEDTYAIIQPRSVSDRCGPAQGKIRKIEETTIRIDARLSNPDDLYLYICDYLRISPPRPVIRVEGWHNTTVRRNDKKETERVCDFDIMLNFGAYLGTAFEQDWWHERTAEDSESVHRGSWRKSTAPGHREGIQLTDEPMRDLRAWCEDYCNSASPLKVFRVNRPVTGLNPELLRSQIAVLVRSTGYQGRLDVTFPTEQKTVDIYSDHMINHWRTSWIRFIFYFTFLWIFTWPMLIFMTKWWDVYTVEWRFSVPVANGRGRRYASISEQQWFEKHKDMICELVLSKYQGDASSHPMSRASLGLGRPGTALGWGHDD